MVVGAERNRRLDIVPHSVERVKGGVVVVIASVACHSCGYCVSDVWGGPAAVVVMAPLSSLLPQAARGAA